MFGIHNVSGHGCPPVLQRLVVVLTYFIAFYCDITPENRNS
jgi:hypothetical protein